MPSHFNSNDFETALESELGAAFPPVKPMAASLGGKAGPIQRPREREAAPVIRNADPQRLRAETMRADNAKHDAAIIAHARRDVPELLAEVVQLNARVAELEAKLVEWRERSTKLFWGAKEFIDDWKKGDFSLSTLAALDAQSLDDALTTFSSSLRETAADPAPADTDTPGSWEEMDGHG